MPDFYYDRRRSGAFSRGKRMERKLSQDKLAEKAGCSVRTITDIEGGTVGMSIERLPTLRRLLHTTPDEVLLGADTGGESWLHAQLTRAGGRRPLPRIPERGARRAEEGAGPHGFRPFRSSSRRCIMIARTCRSLERTGGQTDEGRRNPWMNSECKSGRTRN